MKIYVADENLISSITTLISNTQKAYDSETNTLRRYDIGTYILRLKRYRTQLVSCGYKYNKLKR